MNIKLIVEWWVDLEASSEPTTIVANQDDWKAVVKELRAAATAITQNAREMGL